MWKKVGKQTEITRDGNDERNFPGVNRVGGRPLNEREGRKENEIEGGKRGHGSERRVAVLRGQISELSSKPRFREETKRYT